VRVAIAALLIVHAGSRVATGGVSALGEVLSAIHVPFGPVLAWVITAVEIAGGVALAAGRFVRTLSLSFAVELLAGVALVPGTEDGLVAKSAQTPEYSVLLVACLFALAWGSPGRAPASR
jgi:putative oxidoreductase